MPRPWPVSMADTARAPPPLVSWRARQGDLTSHALLKLCAPPRA
jgi:hypothetical protein